MSDTEPIQSDIPSRHRPYLWFWGIVGFGAFICPVAAALSTLIHYLAFGPPPYQTTIVYPRSILESLKIGAFLGSVFSLFQIWTYVVFAFIAWRRLRSRTSENREIPGRIMGALIGLGFTSAFTSVAVLVVYGFSTGGDVFVALVMLGLVSGIFVLPLFGTLFAIIGWRGW